ncbi:Dermonecrotic toxin N-terminal domain-containing protein (plasmid) [Nitratireductor aquimarinus]|uniref:dermonecrotic toxin domain-containing protein n=1 Tax=Nitratireductor aquimarinus TaxID=889300 RepID=UPI003B5AB09C
MTTYRVSGARAPDIRVDVSAKKATPPARIPRSHQNGRVETQVVPLVRGITLSTSLARLVTGETYRAIDRIAEHTRKDRPDIEVMARETMRAIIKRLTGKTVDPDQLYLNTFTKAQSSRTSFTGWEHANAPDTSTTLTQLLLKNFGAGTQEMLPADLQLNAGIYREGKGAAFYGATNEFPLSVAALRDAIWAEDFQTRVQVHLRDFWKDHFHDVRILAETQFLAEVEMAKDADSLSPEGHALARSVSTAASVPQNGITLADLGKSNASVEDITVRRLDINGYASSDILLLSDKNGRTILHLPGEKQALHEFHNEEELKKWIRRQASLRKGRNMLERHFSLYVRQDGVWYTGVKNSLKKLGTGEWKTGINTRKDRISGDVFLALATSMRARSESDADTLIKSDSEVSRDRWLEQIQTFNHVFWPVTMLVPGVEALFLAGNLGSELALETNRAVTGDTYDERSAASRAAILTGSGILIGSALSTGARMIADRTGNLPPTAGVSTRAMDAELPVVDRPPYQGVLSRRAQMTMNNMGYIISDHPTDIAFDATNDAIERMKERVDALRHKFEDLGREPDETGRFGNHHLVYRVDDFRPEQLFNAGVFRPSYEFNAFSNMLNEPATIGSGSLIGSDNVLAAWRRDKWSRNTLYQYAIVTEDERVAANLDGGGEDPEHFDEVHFRPPLAKDVYLLDSTDQNVRQKIADIVASRSVNTSYGVPLHVYYEYSKGRLRLHDGPQPAQPLGVQYGLETIEQPDEQIDSVSPSRQNWQRIREWVDALPEPGEREIAPVATGSTS